MTLYIFLIKLKKKITYHKFFLPARLSKLGRDLPQGYVLMEHQHVDDNRFEPENKKAHINQNVQVQDLNTTRIVEFCLHWIKLHNYLSYVISPGGK